MRKPTRAEVAKLAGTSTAVVSYVVNNGPRTVSPATRERVLAAIEATGYQPNAIAKALAHGKSSVLGLVIPDLANPFLAELTQSLEHEFFERGYSLLIGDSQDDPNRERSLINTFLSQQLAGLVWYGVNQPQPLDLITSADLPVVLLNHPLNMDLPPAKNRLVHLTTDERAHARLATEHLLTHGYQRIAFLAGPQGRINTQERTKGWEDALKSSGMSTTGLYLNAPFTQKGGFEATASLLETKCDAIVTSNSLQAIGLLAGLSQAGKQVGSDIAVVAVNGTSNSNYTVPPLSAVHLSASELAHNIATALKPNSEIDTISINARFIARTSCGCTEL